MPFSPTGSLTGLSPRVRGKPTRWCTACRKRRSIPACAGETISYGVKRIDDEVYPRVCGGNRERVGDDGATQGLSPRVRGKPSARDASSPSERSIPACAGETRCPPQTPLPGAVYPRVCGGNVAADALLVWRQGLSPRVRGKLVANALPKNPDGSIPACAGETVAAPVVTIAAEVYPRVCGGNRLWV